MHGSNTFLAYAFDLRSAKAGGRSWPQLLDREETGDLGEYQAYFRLACTVERMN